MTQLGAAAPSIAEPTQHCARLCLSYLSMPVALRAAPPSIERTSTDKGRKDGKQSDEVAGSVSAERSRGNSAAENGAANGGMRRNARRNRGGNELLGVKPQSLLCIRRRLLHTKDKILLLFDDNDIWYKTNILRECEDPFCKR